jgi:hypothetical protein
MVHGLTGAHPSVRVALIKPWDCGAPGGCTAYLRCYNMEIDPILVALFGEDECARKQSEVNAEIKRIHRPGTCVLILWILGLAFGIPFMVMRMRERRYMCDSGELCSPNVTNASTPTSSCCSFYCCTAEPGSWYGGRVVDKTLDEDAPKRRLLSSRHRRRHSRRDLGRYPMSSKAPPGIESDNEHDWWPYVGANTTFPMDPWGIPYANNRYEEANCHLADHKTDLFPFDGAGSWGTLGDYMDRDKMNIKLGCNCFNEERGYGRNRHYVEICQPMFGEGGVRIGEPVRWPLGPGLTACILPMILFFASLCARHVQLKSYMTTQAFADWAPWIRQTDFIFSGGKRRPAMLHLRLSSEARAKMAGGVQMQPFVVPARGRGEHGDCARIPSPLVRTPFQL